MHQISNIELLKYVLIFSFLKNFTTNFLIDWKIFLKCSHFR